MTVAWMPSSYKKQRNTPRNHGSSKKKSEQKQDSCTAAAMQVRNATELASVQLCATYAFVWHQEYAPVCWPRCISLFWCENPRASAESVRLAHAGGAQNFDVAAIQPDQPVLVVPLDGLAPEAATTEHLHGSASTNRRGTWRNRRDDAVLRAAASQLMKNLLTMCCYLGVGTQTPFSARGNLEGRWRGRETSGKGEGEGWNRVQLVV